MSDTATNQQTTNTMSSEVTGQELKSVLDENARLRNSITSIGRATTLILMVVVLALVYLLLSTIFENLSLDNLRGALKDSDRRIPLQKVATETIENAADQLTPVYTNEFRIRTQQMLPMLERKITNETHQLGHNIANRYRHHLELMVDRIVKEAYMEMDDDLAILRTDGGRVEFFNRVQAGMKDTYEDLTFKFHDRFMDDIENLKLTLLKYHDPRKPDRRSEELPLEREFVHALLMRLEYEMTR